MTPEQSVVALFAAKRREQRSQKPRREAIREYLLSLNGEWATLYDICRAVGGSQTGTSAKLRDLRKPQYGGLQVPSRKRPGTGNTWEYRIA